MTIYETAIRHVAQGTTYSWDLTALLGLGIKLPDSLREKLLQSTTTPAEAAQVTSLYTRKLLGYWRG
ncbi:MAG: hypothetical protein PHR30_08540 [Gallionellaceae bacterium]|nr:hypothetical protein [Gallionellaceae bacterium]MDD5365371.1 hypothetical protein [Gallionellaceae bacterium]